MGLELGLWRVDGKPVRLSAASMPLESRLEKLIVEDPSMLGGSLLIIGQQVPTAHGTYIDLLALDAEGTVHVLELKRDRTPRDVVAQVLDYGSWVETLAHVEIQEIYRRHDPVRELDEAFVEAFGGSPPDEINRSHQLTIIAAALDPATERIVTYLATTHGVPINVVFFRYFVDDGRDYLARTWLLDEVQVAAAPPARRAVASTKEPWNGQDWYVSFGEESGTRVWADAKSHGFVSAGGGEWFSRTLRALPVGARVFACVPKRGYVGVGTVVGEARPADEALLLVKGERVPFRSLPLSAPYSHAAIDQGDSAEYVVPVEWLATRDLGEAIWKTGMFANQNSACKLRSSFTLEEVSRALGLD